ncbi:F0F1 ATP synthase subunit delta [Pelagibaculum spongiae]|uniref:ATP synthase subunit delta n=1 Tax=Pelagibaculum spongiae TaxID=2080658 RepID=A0A2V1H0C6_9GAMM|nr:F0F1 ATP synthase subunit delta [Pelagibaculum spongiae]PVZ68120.1 F0F1 ATP synthase subunit delta [Pelagibaculum spongiae]
MAEAITIARPYARAAFEFAREAGDLDGWSQMLGLAGQVASDATMQQFLHNPKATREQITEGFLSVCKDELNDLGRNFLKLLSENDRLAALPEIAVLFEQHKAELGHIAQVQVTSAVAFPSALKDKLAEALKRNLGQDVRLAFDEDVSLIGGAVIRAGDKVIDGSVRGKLQRLADTVKV